MKTFLIVFFVVNGLAYIGLIDVERPKITKAGAFFSVLINMLIAFLIYKYIK